MKTIETKEKKELLNKEIDRRTFIKVGGATAAGITAFSKFFTVRNSEAATGENAPDTVSGSNVKFRLSVCQNCHSRCGIMGKVVDGTLVKIDGNPYHPNNMEEDERLTFATAVATAEATPGRLCPKGHSGVQVLYDPYRIKHPLKRVGNRGSGRWEVISWATAFSEIASQISSLIPTSTRLTTYINSSVPELGPIANQLMFAPGRSTDGEIIERIFKNTYGTTNYRLDHTSICEVSHHVANELMTWNESTNSGRKNHFKPDLISAEFIILFGANYAEANFPMLALGRKLAEFIKGGGKLAVVDPRFSNSAAKADWWVAAKPGTDAAVALGMAHYIISNSLYNSTYLTNANSAAATADSEKTWTDAVRLVITAKSSGAPSSITVGKYLRWGDIYPVTAAGNTNKVAWSSSTPVEIGTSAVEGTLLPGEKTITIEGTSETVTVKTVFELLKEKIVTGKTVAYYANIAGVSETTLTTLATEFTSHGKKSVANAYRGTVQHTNGVYSQMSVMLLNTLIGNYDWKGGNAVGGGGYSYDSGMKGTGMSGIPTGPRIDRTKVSTTFYNTLVTNYPTIYSYPAQRPWFPYGTHGNFQEVIPSIAEGYPYPCKVLITYWNAWPYSTPALRQVFEATVADTNKVPLFVAISPDMGEVASWADYILPDTTYLEKWSFPGMTPTILTKATSFRQPLVGTYDGNAWDADFNPSATNAYTPVYPDTKMFEDILIGLMNALSLTTDLSGSALPTRAWAHVSTGVNNLATSSSKTAADIVAKGGAFEDPGNSYNGDYLKSTYGNEIKIYIEQLLTQIDSMGDGSAKFDPMPHYETIKDIVGNEVSVSSSYPYQLVTYKPVLHAQARTQALPWLTVWQPENFIEINTQDAATLGIETYDQVRVSSPSYTSGVIGRAKVTEALRPGVVAISHSFGHWQLGSSPWYEDSVIQSSDSTRTLGVQPTVLMQLDPYLGDVTLQDKIGCSASFYDTWVKIEKV